MYMEKMEEQMKLIITIRNFAEQIGATLTVMKKGEHWFHTQEQIKFLDDWLANRI